MCVHVMCNTHKALLACGQLSGDGVPLDPASRANQGDSYSAPGITKLISEGGNEVDTLNLEWSLIKSLKFRVKVKEHQWFPAHKSVLPILCIQVFIISYIWSLQYTHLIWYGTHSKDQSHPRRGRLGDWWVEEPCLGRNEMLGWGCTVMSTSRV